jgi:hypothetical protein
MEVSQAIVILQKCHPYRHGQRVEASVEISIGDGEDRRTYEIDCIEQEPDGTIYIRTV